MSNETHDVEALSPNPDTVTLESGFVVRVERLKTRGMFKLLKVVTRGAGPILMQMPLDFNDTEAFIQQFIAIVIMAIPEAEDEAVDFIRSMVVPAEYDEDAKSKSAQAKNEKLFERLYRELQDPEPGDTLDIITKIIENEGPHIAALGKRLAATLKVQVSSLEAKS
jgi:hypothetical protein